MLRAKLAIMTINYPPETSTRRENDDVANERGLLLILDLLQNFHTPYKEELTSMERECKVLERQNLELLYQLKYARISTRETLIEVCFHDKLCAFDSNNLGFYFLQFLKY